MSDDLRLLALTQLRTALERHDWGAVQRSYELLGGMRTGEAPKAAGDPSTPRQMGVLTINARGPDGWPSLENVR